MSPFPNFVEAEDKNQFTACYPSKMSVVDFTHILVVLDGLILNSVKNFQFYKFLSYTALTKQSGLESITKVSHAYLVTNFAE